MRPTAAFVVVAALLLAIVAGVAGGPAGARAQSLPPRPTLPPVTPTSALPTTTPVPEPEPGPRRLKPGRITGTVIDVATGAPAPNVAVRVGSRIVVSDANGNYDWSGAPVGSYEVALALPADWGVALQGTLTAVVGEADTTVQHLFFRSS